MKTIAFYLPQYHEIPENNAAWGDGFTEWTNVKKAKPSFPNHVQPRVPLNEYYYDLQENDTRKWQSDLAEKYGLHGFCYYHYWFNGKLLLEKPGEKMLLDKTIKTKFCFSWANEPWSKNWTGETKNVIVPQTYGDESDWKKHFDYLLPFFKDDRYIKESGKPMFIIYKPDIIPNCFEMMDYWNSLATEAGLPGIHFGFQFPTSYTKIENSKKFDFSIEFEPIFTRMEDVGFSDLKNIRQLLSVLLSNPKAFFTILNNKIRTEVLKKPATYDYVKTCEKIVARNPKFENSIPGMFTGWDKTPRNGSKATVYLNSSPETFEHYLKIQLKRAKELYSTDYLFITAWNEWGEGAYLEPDTNNEYAYLEALKRAQEL